MEFKGWDKLYEEISSKIVDKITSIKWVDLWHNQVGFLQDEHDISTPAIFLSFRLRNTEEISSKVQRGIIQVDFYYYYETFLDTFSGAINKTDALEYLQTLTDIHKHFHATSGENYSEMKRTGMAPVDTGTSGNLYRITFDASIMDASAAIDYQEVIPGDVEIKRGNSPEQIQEGLYHIPTR